ncbi:UNVERIFIED_CONTAM: hypothetical protein RMT77_015084 [Armadillidium vulgare]
MNFVPNKVKMVQIIISFLMVALISVDGCSVPSKYFEKETSANTLQGPVRDTTEEPSINTSQKLTENTTEEQLLDSTDQPATYPNEVPKTTENPPEDSTGQPATTNEVLTTNSTEEPLMSTQDSKYCSFPHCHVFKNGNLVLFPGGKNVRGYQNGANICHYSNGTIFVPRTEEDNKIWLEFIKMLYDEDNSFKGAWYPMDYEYSKTKAFYWLFERGMDEVNDSDYKLKIDDPNDGQPDFDDLTFADYDSRGRSFIYFSHDNENVFGQLQIRDGSKEAGFVVCSAR